MKLIIFYIKKLNMQQYSNFKYDETFFRQRLLFQKKQKNASSARMHAATLIFLLASMRLILAGGCSPMRRQQSRRTASWSTALSTTVESKRNFSADWIFCSIKCKE
jgi:hypothetical protein